MFSSNQFLTPRLVFRLQSVFKNRFPEAYFARCVFYAGPASDSLLFSLPAGQRSCCHRLISELSVTQTSCPWDSLVFLTILPREPCIYSVPIYIYIYIFFFFFLTFHTTEVTEYITFVCSISHLVSLLRPIRALVSISTSLLLIVE